MSSAYTQKIRQLERWIVEQKDDIRTMERANENSKRTQCDIDSRTEGLREKLTQYENELDEIRQVANIADWVMWIAEHGE